MTWLKGTTTLGAMAPLFTQLVCGEVADGVGNTCAVGDRWVRENVGQDTIRTPTSVDYAGMPQWRMKSGYFNLLNSDGNGNQGGRQGGASVCVVTSPFTSNPTSAHGRYAVYLTVTTVNSVAGNYSTARLAWVLWDMDANALIQSGSGVAPSSGGLASSFTNGLTLTVSDPTGLLTQGTSWVRAFTNTYNYGIDWWPFWNRRGSGVTAPTWGTAPPGTAGTDYDVIDQAVATTAFSSFLGGVGSIGPNDTTNLFSGLGIKTGTGIGSLYTGTYPVAAMKCRLWNHPTLGIVGMDMGPSVLDTVNGSVFRTSGCIQNTNWVQCIQNPGLATSSTAVQYFMSVKPTGIYLVLNADPGGSGKLGTGFVGTFTNYDSTYDVLPQMVSRSPVDFTGNTTSSAAFLQTTIAYWRLRRMLNGDIGIVAGTATGTTATTLTDTAQSRTVNGDVGYTVFAGTSSGVVTSNTATAWTVSSWTGGTPASNASYYVSRDWQTGWQRTDFYQQGVGTQSSTYGLQNSWIMTCVGYYPGDGNPGTFPVSQAKPSYDGNWWLWGWQYSEGNIANSNLPGERDFIRGYQNTRFLALTGQGWGNGDELTDTNTGEKFLLLIPDYAAAAHRIHIGTNQYVGGVAVAEL